MYPEPRRLLSSGFRGRVVFLLVFLWGGGGFVLPSEPSKDLSPPEHPTLNPIPETPNLNRSCETQGGVHRASRVEGL